MKHILQTAIGVFIGAIAAFAVIEAWQSRKESLIAEDSREQSALAMRARREEAEKLRSLMSQRSPETLETMEDPTLTERDDPAGGEDGKAKSTHSQR